MMRVQSNAQEGLGGQHSADGYLRELALRLLTVPAEQIAPAIAEAQAKLTRLLGIERSMLIETEDRSETPVQTYSCIASGPADQSFTCQPDKCPVCQKALRGELVRIPMDDNTSQEVVKKGETVCALCFKSALGFPLFDGEKVYGALVFASSQSGWAWPEDLVAQLDFVARIFGSALDRKRAELKKLASVGFAIAERKVLEEKLQTSEAFISSIVSSLNVELVVLDKHGVIIAVNEAWNRFARENGIDPVAVSCGANYLDVCRRAMAAGDAMAGQTLEAIEAVLQGSREEMLLEYPCDSPTVSRWFLMRVAALRASAGGVVIVHSDLTQVKEARDSLRTALVEVEKNKLQEENVYLRQKSKSDNGHHRVIGQSQALRRVLAQVDQVARTDSTVLLLGETGTGKELMAASIHELSPRRGRTLVTVNCAAIPGALVESELFGREKGAFTGSLSRQVGKFELADHSTIFLDEVGELSSEVQVKLLRVLEARQIERLGNPKPVPVNVRIIAATNRDLEKDVADGKFRQDLYYRLNVFPISLPPLRERREDIPLLVWAFVDEYARTFNKNIESVGRESMEALQCYPWPGNIRELRNLIERAMIVATGPKLRIQLPATLALSASAIGRKLEEVEREHVLSVLEKSGWRVRGPNCAAETLGLKPTTLEARMAKLGIHRPGAGSDT